MKDENKTIGQRAARIKPLVPERAVSLPAGDVDAVLRALGPNDAMVLGAITATIDLQKGEAFPKFKKKKGALAVVRYKSKITKAEAFDQIAMIMRRRAQAVGHRHRAATGIAYAHQRFSVEK